MKKLGTLFLLLLFAFSLEAQELSFSVKDQALQELSNIEQQNQQLLKIISDYENNYRILKIDYDSIKALTIAQGESLLVRNQALINSERLLKASQTRESIYIIFICIVVGYALYH